MATAMERSVMKKFAGYPFQPAERNKKGELIFRKGKLIRWFVYAAFVLGVIALIGSSYIDDYDADEQVLFVFCVGIEVVLFAFLSLVVAITKIRVTEHSLFSYRWYGTKFIHFSEVTQVGYSRFYGGIFILKTSQRTVRIPAENVGTAELVKLLVEKVGDEKCAQAVAFMNKRKQEFAGLG
ncbi:hypothetical protein [Paenibacillus sp. SI8]|uniref:hypothetical protein n=1 Tax=unclassified Paenibacillus TaxID=185978 RepID=UPI0034679FCB